MDCLALSASDSAIPQSVVASDEPTVSFLTALLRGAILALLALCAVIQICVIPPLHFHVFYGRNSAV